MALRSNLGAGGAQAAGALGGEKETETERGRGDRKLGRGGEAGRGEEGGRCPGVQVSSRLYFPPYLPSSSDSACGGGMCLLPQGGMCLRPQAAEIIPPLG